MYNGEVKVLQQLLKDLGYLVIQRPTTYFGLATQTALKQYQKDHHLRVTGITDVSTRVALNQDLADPVLAIHAPVALLTKDLVYKDSGNAVTLLQTKLKALGYFTGEVTGYFGLVTKKAVADFQKANGIKPANGRVGPATRAVLNK